MVVMSTLQSGPDPPSREVQGDDEYCEIEKAIASQDTERELSWIDPRLKSLEVERSHEELCSATFCPEIPRILLHNRKDVFKARTELCKYLFEDCERKKMLIGDINWCRCFGIGGAKMPHDTGTGKLVALVDKCLERLFSKKDRSC